jgi:hypothetical protein
MSGTNDDTPDESQRAEHPTEPSEGERDESLPEGADTAQPSE